MWIIVTDVTSFCQSVMLLLMRILCAHTAEQIRGPAWGVDSWGPKKHCIRWGCKLPPTHTLYDAAFAIRCGLRQITLATCSSVVFFLQCFDAVSWVMWLIKLYLKHEMTRSLMCPMGRLVLLPCFTWSFTHCSRHISRTPPPNWGCVRT